MAKELGIILLIFSSGLSIIIPQGVHQIYAECAPQNTASWRLMEKIGMKREAHLRENVTFHQDDNGQPIYWDTYIYAMLNPYEKV